MYVTMNVIDVSANLQQQLKFGPQNLSVFSYSEPRPGPEYSQVLG